MQKKDLRLFLKRENLSLKEGKEEFMEEIVIVGATRTPIGTFGGSLIEVSARKLAMDIMSAATERAGIEKKDIGFIYTGNCFDPMDNNISRIASVLAGFPIETPSISLSCTCGSGLQAIISCVHAINSGDTEVAMACGVESMSTAPYILPTARWGQRLQHGQLFDLVWKAMQEYPIGGGMGLTAENLAVKYNISREEQDRFSILSHEKACKAIRDGRFKDEITPVKIPRKKGEFKIVDTDEHPRPDVTLEKLAQLPAAFKKDGTVTAGNACGLNDAAAAVVLMTAKKSKELGVKPLAKILSYAVAGVDPAYMGIGPVPAIRNVVQKAGLTINDIDLFEINEAFAAQYLACEKELGLNRDIVNVNGGGIALGHPVGSTGCRLVVTLIHEMSKRNLRKGVASLCAGGGHGFALAVERV
jgi:acetyl-CoA C-acetyltransferase